MGSRTGFSKERKQEMEAVPHRKSVLREYTETILVCVLVLLFPRTFVFQQSEIPSSSMEDTILVGDYILVNRFLYAPTSFDWEKKLLPVRDVRRGDIVVFKHPDLPEVDYIKRVIGLPGDDVVVRDGYVWVNGRRQEEPYVGPLYRGPEPGGVFEVQVEHGHYFVMGDHRNQSSDSRVWGQVPHQLLKGRAFMVLFSTDAVPPEGTPVGQVTPTSLFRKVINLVYHARLDRSFTAIR